MTFEEFEKQKKALGFDEVIERVWAPNQVVEAHGHPFVADALVVRGEMWLTCRGETRHLSSGDTFALAADEPHSERYGPEGAAYWVARKNLI